MDNAWLKTNTAFNRYIQKFRRSYPSLKVQYIRSIEAHRDSYPHIHVILQFATPLTIDNARYFDPLLYRQWKRLWDFGLSDYQPPKSRERPILYIIKYISKSSSIKTIWKKMLPKMDNVASRVVQTNQPSSTDSQPGPTDSSVTNTTADLNIKFHETNLLCKQYKIKQVTWSRGFVFPSIPKRKPISLLQTKLI